VQTLDAWIGYSVGSSYKGVNSTGSGCMDLE
jgi:hypothetical protein